MSDHFDTPGVVDTDAERIGPPLGPDPDPEPDPGPPVTEEPRRPVVTRDRAAHPPFGKGNAIGDAGRQAEVVALAGPLTVGMSDTELDFVTAVPFEIRACATRGLSHRHGGTPRQDAFALALDEHRVVLAVADGVSQGPWSHVAAETAARAACKLALDQAERSGDIDWSQVSRRVSLRIVEEAEYRRLVDPPDDVDDLEGRIARTRSVMSSTLVVAAVDRDSDTDGCFPVELALLAGDSGVYLISPTGIRLVVGGKVDGDSPISSSAVRPLPGLVEPETHSSALGEGQGLVLVSDGLGDPIGDGTGEVGLELARRWQTPPAIDRFLLDVNFLRRSFDDDRTAVGLWLLPPSTDAPPPPGSEPSPDGPAEIRRR